jgi:hypothetical protein
VLRGVAPRGHECRAGRARGVSAVSLEQQAGLPGQIPDWMQWMFFLLVGSAYPGLSIDTAGRLASLARDLQGAAYRVADGVGRQSGAVVAAAGPSAAAEPMAGATAQSAASVSAFGAPRTAR